MTIIWPSGEKQELPDSAAESVKVFVHFAMWYERLSKNQKKEIKKRCEEKEKEQKTVLE